VFSLNLRLRLGNTILEIRAKRLREAIGIASFNRFDRNLHHALFDIDGGTKQLMEALDYINLFYEEWSVHKTPNGFHVVTYDKPTSFLDCANILMNCPNIDFTYVIVGLKRGYWFLETRDKIVGPFTYMKIERTY